MEAGLQGDAEDAADPSTQADVSWLNDGELQWTMLGHEAGHLSHGDQQPSQRGAVQQLLAVPGSAPPSASGSSPFSILYPRGIEANVGQHWHSLPDTLHPHYSFHSPSQDEEALYVPGPASNSGVGLNTPTWSTSGTTPPGAASHVNKRVRKDSLLESNDDAEQPVEAVKLQSQRIIVSLITAVADDHPLRLIDSWSCARQNCFMMAPLDQSPSDYYKKPLTFARFAVHIVDPFAQDTAPSLPLDQQIDPQSSAYTITRPAGRSLHLLITVMPSVDQADSLDNGFALIIACKRTQDKWAPICLASYNDSTSGKTRARTRDVAFAANLEHYTDDASGRRIWGQRTSHVRRKGKEGMKAVRLQPKGPLGVNVEEEVCFYVALFDTNDTIMRHANGEPCIAQTNIVQYTPKDTTTLTKELEDGLTDKPEEGESLLMRELAKMTFFERARVAGRAHIDDTMRLTLISNDRAIHERLGIKIFDSASLPPTAVALSTYQILDTLERVEWPEISEELAARTRASVRSLGWHHADPMMTDPTIGKLDSCFETIRIGFELMVEQDVDLEEAWLRDVGIRSGMDIRQATLRAKAGGTLMRAKGFRGTQTVCMHNPYPDRILVDSLDADKVHCLADTTNEAEVMMGDRMWPLVRMAFGVKAQRDQMYDLIFAPYVEGFCSRGDIITDPTSTSRYPHAGYPVQGPVVDEEKFYLMLHAMHLKFFHYWIRFRSPASVRRIHRRLMEEDRLLDQAYFAPGGFEHFSADAED